MTYVRSISKIAVIFLLLLCIGCARKVNKTDEESSSKSTFIINLEHFEAVDTVYMTDLFETPNFIQLQSPDSLLIGYINEIIIWENYIYVLDKNIAKQVFRFNIDGSFDRLIGSVGKGAGEYQRPDDISIDVAARQLLVYSRQERKICFYDLDKTNVLFEKRLEFAADEIQPLGKGSYAIFNHDAHNLNSASHNNDYNVAIYDSTFSHIKNRYLPFLYKEGEGKAVVSTGRYFNVSDSETLLNWRFNDTVYSVSDKDIQPSVVFKFGNKKVTANNYEETTAGFILKGIESGRFASIFSNVLIADSTLITKFRSPLPSGKSNETELFYLIQRLAQNSKPIISRTLADDFNNFPFNFPVSTHDQSLISVLYPDEINEETASTFIRKFESKTGISLRASYNPILFFYKPLSN